MYLTTFYNIIWATVETMYMVIAATAASVLLGLPLGTMMFINTKIRPNPTVARILSAIVNISRSIPFIILLVALIPVTRYIVGTSIGTTAAIVPLTLGAIPFFARIVDNVYQSLPDELLEAGNAMGASVMQLIRLILFPEALSSIIHGITLTAITLVNYSAMAGTVGGGGLGDLAIRYGYQRFNLTVMLITIAILIVMVQLIQYFGDKIAVKMLRQ